MRDENDQIVSLPICQLKSEYKDAAMVGWQNIQNPLDEWSDANWDDALRLAQELKNKEVTL